jgi:PBSX family phage terminase large subunit
VNKEITVQGFTPHQKQKEVVELCLDETTKYIICCTGRQFGKTFLAMNILLKWALEDNGANLMFVSPVYSQAKKVFSELVTAIADTGLCVSMNKSELFITFINGSIIYFRSGEREDSLRGYTLDYLIMDEAAYQKEAVWKQVLRPTVLVKGKKVLFISTPKGTNWFSEIANMGYSEDYTQYKTFHATSFDTPFITEEELKEAKLSLPDTIYRQEILAEFIGDGGEVFSNLNKSCVLTSYPSKDTSDRYYAGLDIGRANDYTVLTILNTKGEVVRIYRERQNSWNIIVSEVVKHLKEFGARCTIEINGIGDPIFEQIKKQYSNVEPFFTSNESKQNIIEELILTLNEEKIKLPTKELNEDLYKELSVFTYEYSPRTRKVKYGAPSAFHDDMVMSLALANDSLKKKINYGKYVIR